MSYDLADLSRRVANMLREGIVSELDDVTGWVRVRVEDESVQLETDFLPVFAVCAGPNQEWSPPEPGEGVMVLCPMGDLAQGRVLAGIPHERFPAPGGSREVWRRTFKDGARIEYDRVKHVLTATLPESGLAKITAQTVVAEAALTKCTGNLLVEGALAVEGASSLKGGGTVAGGKGDATFEINGRVLLNGNAHVNGDIDATGHVMDAGGNSNHHSH
ncbi:phage baseplate assembly protein V [Pandoraea fibrosis]|uniref:Baseplate protein n=1 Tax=Pandoraea fibrosis TaxID=1891094 RepID=A0A5E4XG36_9BURK|nr:phage baseplate assembly protein V [Pandoraea fibrosis]VVE35192.1 baseplate protein [Pandoraea fibrosis]